MWGDHMCMWCYYFSIWSFSALWNVNPCTPTPYKHRKQLQIQRINSFGDLCLICEYFRVVLSRCFCVCVCVSLSLFCFICLVFINIKAFIEVHLLSNITYIHLQLYPTLGWLSQREPACCLQQTGTIIVFKTLEDTEDCLLVCGNISSWLSHTVTYTDCMASLLSPEPQQGHCPVCAKCLHLCTSVMNGSVVSHMQLLDSV